MVHNELYQGDFVFCTSVSKHGQIISVEDDGEILVIFNGDEFDYDNSHSVKPNEIELISRDYKIIKYRLVTDLESFKQKFVADLAPMKKIISFSMEKKYVAFSIYNPIETELFIMPLDSSLAQDYLNNPEIPKTIYFRDFKTDLSYIDNNTEYARYLKHH
jgi:hypothetical protein